MKKIVLDWLLNRRAENEKRAIPLILTVDELIKELEVPETCVCKDCSEQLKCEHASFEDHQVSICGRCSQ